jgi:hypothetical protein
MERLAETTPEPLRTEELDEELAQLPPPPRAERTWSLLLLLLSAVSALALAFALRAEAGFALNGGAGARELGELRAQTLAPGQSVSFVATFAANGATQMDRSLTSGSERVVPVLGREDVWVVMRTNELPQTGRFVPVRAVQGHVVPLYAPGLRYRGTADAIGAALGKAPPSAAVLVIDGEEPSNARWALFVVLACVGFALWNAFTAFRLLKRVAE